MSSGAYVLIGSGLGALVALAGGILERGWGRRTELAAAAAAWLAAMDAYALLLSTLPHLPTGQHRLDRWIARFSEEFQERTGSWVIPVAQAWLFSPITKRLENSTDRLWTTTNRLLFIAPKRVLTQLVPAVELIGEGASRVGDPTLLAQWLDEVRPPAMAALRRESRPWWARWKKEVADADEDAGPDSDP